jgi:hypothetical protein
MTQPPGFIHPQHQSHVCKLHKALYGLKQAPWAWFSRLSSKLIQLGFISSRSDTSLFISHSTDYLMLVLIYVDDIIITFFSHVVIQSLLQELHNDFAVKDLGPPSYFLGIEVMPCNQGIILSQQRYILDILKHTKMADAKLISSPMASSTHLFSFEGDLLLDPTLYKSAVGALQYVCITRPYISFCVNKLS